MKALIILILSLGSINGYSQKIGRFRDSLTLSSNRTWHTVNGARFTRVKDNCSFGMELTFYKEGSKVRVRECEQGAWKELMLTFRVRAADGNHYVDLLDPKTNTVGLLEVQLLGGNGRFKTELTYFNIKGRESYTMISDGHQKKH
ncbi:hypothetical protein GZH53_15790 [Flavihumibacter sp. R14]|nr:hypothetical protein [Flavihumibacter soli]